MSNVATNTAVARSSTMLTIPNDILVAILSLDNLTGHDVFCLSRTCEPLMKRVRQLKLTHLSFRILETSDLRKIATCCMQYFTSTVSLSLAFPIRMESIFSMPDLPSLTSLKLSGGLSVCRCRNNTLFGDDKAAVLRNLQKLSITGAFHNPLSFMNRINWPPGLTELALSLNQSKYNEEGVRAGTPGNQLAALPAPNELIDLTRIPSSLVHLSLQLLLQPSTKGCFVAGQLPRMLHTLRMSFNFPLYDATHFPSRSQNPFVCRLPSTLTSIDTHAVATTQDISIVSDSIVLESVTIRKSVARLRESRNTCCDKNALYLLRSILTDVRMTHNVRSLRVPQLKILRVYLSDASEPSVATLPDSCSNAVLRFPNLSLLVIDRVENSRHLLEDWFFQQFRHVAIIDIKQAFAKSMILLDVQLVQLQSVHPRLFIRERKLIAS